MSARKPNGGRSRRKKMISDARDLLTDPRHDPGAALAAMKEAFKRPRKLRRAKAPKRVISSTADGTGSPWRIGRGPIDNKLMFDTPTRRRIRQVEAEGKKVLFRLRADGDIIWVYINDDAEPAGKVAGWYHGDQRSGKPAREMPIARDVREAEERYLREVGRIMRGSVRGKKPATKAMKIADMVRELRAENLKPDVIVRQVADALNVTPRYVREVAKTVR